MALQTKTVKLIEAAGEILRADNPATLRQVYYRLVSKQALKNVKSEYDRLGRALVNARKLNMIPWDWIEDRLRVPRAVATWESLGDYIDSVKWGYRRDIWATQNNYVEVWVEKDALSGIFEDVLREYRVTLNVGRGYDGWTSIKNAAARYRNFSYEKQHARLQAAGVEMVGLADYKPWGRDDVTILYFGDFDPSGADMARSLRERIGHFGCEPEVVWCALLRNDITQYDLPPDFTKAGDTRAVAFIEKYGDAAVELDALPVAVLRERIKAEVEKCLDLDALAAVREAEGKDQEKLDRVLDSAND